MLQKIGISKCSSEKIKYFNVSTPLENIYLGVDYPVIDTIVSFMISYEIIKINIDDSIISRFSKNTALNHSLVNVLIEITYKIIYSSKGKKSLHILNHKSYSMAEIKIPYVLDGFSVKQLLSLKKLKAEVFIENLNITITGNRILVINPYILTNIISTPDYSMAYIIKMPNGDENIFTSFSDGSKLLQKTFTKGVSYKNLLWCPFTNDISYLSNESGEFELYSINMSTRAKPRLYSGINNINSFSYISSSLIVLSSNCNNSKEIFILNTQSGSITKLTNSIDGQSFLLPKYSNVYEKIFFLNKTESSSYVCRMNTNALDLNYLIEKKDILDFVIDDSSKFILLLAKENSDEKFGASIINIETLVETEINLLNEDYEIKGMFFIRNKEEVAFCVYHNGKDDILIYNYESNFTKNITNNPIGIFICEFTSNFSDETIYYVSNKRGNYDVYSLSLEDLTNKTLVNSSSQNISLAYKGL